jgi:hypothetical protein
MFHGVYGNKDIAAVFSESIDEQIQADVTGLIGSECRPRPETFEFVRGCKWLELGVVMVVSMLLQPVFGYCDLTGHEALD